MKNITLSLLTALFITYAHAQTQQHIDNQIAFTKLYGYVRYFHPSDEAAGIDWERFAIYGSEKVTGCSNQLQLKETLSALFTPIAPTLKIMDDTERASFDERQLIPPSLSGYKIVAWQHIGIGTTFYKENQFQSARTNRPVFYEKYTQLPLTGESMSNGIDAKPYQNKPFILKGKAKLVKGPGFGHFWARIDKTDKSGGFFDNSVNDLIKQPDWKEFEIKGVIDADADRLRFGVLLEGAGDLWVDDVSLLVKEGNDWKEVYSTNFNNQNKGSTLADPLNLAKKTSSDLYIYGIVADPNSPVEKWAEIKSTSKHPQKPTGKWEKHTSLFKTYPNVGEYIEKKIGNGLKIIMPVSLYGNDNNTYPAADQAKLNDLKNTLEQINKNAATADSLNTRLADIAITWNVFQHFFPYMDLIETDWNQDLKEAIIAAHTDENASDFYKTLRRFTANLQDAHVNVSWTKSADNFYLPVKWTWAEDKLVITDVVSKSSGLKKGDIITAINNESSKDYFKRVEQYISAATPASRTEKALTESLPGPQNSSVELDYLAADNKPAKVTLKRNLNGYAYLKSIPRTDTIKYIDGNITYINMGIANMKAIDNILPRLQKNKAIICDFRNCRIDNDNNHFIEYLLTQKDTATHWMQNAQRIYPDRERTVGYITEGFELKPAKPHLNAKVIFIVDASDYSWAESYMSIIDHYKLATIIGQPTGGTNGDVISFSLPGNYSISFSGLKVTQLDGSQHQGVGTKPDIYVTKTINGIREGRDEFLEKAIEVANDFLINKVKN